jgi:hypothetical protein
MGRKPKNETQEQWLENLRKRFHTYCNAGATDECWDWKGATQKQGYGMLGLGTLHNNVSKGAHVAAYIIYRDQAFRDYDQTSFHHTCLNEGCVNPYHLQLMSHYENILRQGHLAPGVIDKLIHEFPAARTPLLEAQGIILAHLGINGGQ